MTPRTHLPIALITALIALGALACGGDEAVILNKVQMEVDACKAASEPVYEVKFSVSSGYNMQTSICKNATVGQVKIDKTIYADVPFGPYTFKLRKNTSDGRWFINQVKWPELDEARSILTWDNISDADYDKAIELFTKAEKQAPALEEIPMSKLDILLKRRRNANKDKDPDPEGLGPALKTYYAEVLKRAADIENPDLGARARLRIIRYYSEYRIAAEEASVPSESAEEWERGAIKALENDLKEAEKNKNEAEIKRIKAEIEQREKEIPENRARRERDAAVMAKRAAALKKNECAEIQALGGVAPNDNDLKTEINAVRGSVDCSGG